MTTTIRKQCFTAILFTLLALCTTSYSQDTRTFNQNASRSNRNSLSIYFSPVYSSAINSKNDSLLFRGSGAGIRFGADYFFGKAGIGITSGFGSSSADNTVINNFLNRSSIPQDQLLITKTNQQNMYVLLGPSIRFGNTVQLYAHAKGGLFINNAGAVNIQQRGAQRTTYRNEATGKNIYPGFLAGLNVQYAIRPGAWSIGFGADYMNTKTEVNNYDARRGGAIEPLKLSRNITDVVAGITIRYSISSPRDAASGLSTGRRSRAAGNTGGNETVSRDAASGLPTGRRTFTPISPNGNGAVAPRDAASGLPTGRRSAIATDPNCGPVTRKVTNPDGTSEEMTFSCPADALDYEKWTGKHIDKPMLSSGDARLHTVSNAAESRGIVSGRLTWSSSGSGIGIVTNSTGATRGGSTTMNSQTSSTRTTNQSSFGTLVRMSARETGSGIATGKRDHSSGMSTGRRERGSGLSTGRRERGSGMATGRREKGSGMSTGRRTYEPVFIEGEGGVCTSCVASVVVNPLYTGSGTHGNNPFHTGKEREPVNADENCDGIADMDIFLVDISGNILAKTKTERCGDFFFANVPEGSYTVRISGSIITKKGYDVSMKSKTDLLGSVTGIDDWMELTMQTGPMDSMGGMSQRAGISTSRSNIRTKQSAISGQNGGVTNIKTIRVAAGDVDGDGFDEMVAGNTISDFSISRLAVGGVEISIGKSPGAQPLETTWTDEQGEFEFTDLETGTYSITMGQEIFIEDETYVFVSGDKAANINTSESNLDERKQLSPHPNVVQKNVPVRWSAPEVLRSVLVEADLDGDGVYETDVTNRMSDEFTSNEKGEPQQRAGISTSRSNLRTRGQLQQIGNDLFTCTATGVLNNKDVPVRVVYKTKHDTAKNSIQNIR